MPDQTSPVRADLVPVPEAEIAELIALGLNLTKGRVRQANIAREVNSAVAERVLEYFRSHGMVVMRPPPRPPWSNNPDHNGRQEG